MWATNWPVSLKQLPYAKVVELYRGHMSFFSAEDRKEIFSGQCSACGLSGCERADE